MISVEYKLTIVNEMILTMKLYKEEFDGKIDSNVSFHINDNIVHDYEGLGELVTKIKCIKYQQNKIANEINVHTFNIKHNDTNVNKYVSQTSLINSKNDKFMYDNCSVFDQKMSNMSEEEINAYIGNITEQYKQYNDNVNHFLAKYGHFGNISANKIFTKAELNATIKDIFEKIVQSAKWYLYERLNHKSADHFEKTMKDLVLSNDNTKQLFYFPNNTVLKQQTLVFRDNLFILYVLLKSIPETKVFLNEIINEFASVNEMDEIFGKYYKAIKQYKMDKRLNRPLLPRTMWESFTHLFIQHTSNGEIKVPRSDYFRYCNFVFEINGIENEYITLENKMIRGEYVIPHYNYINSIFNIM